MALNLPRINNNLLTLAGEGKEVLERIDSGNLMLKRVLVNPDTQKEVTVYQEKVSLTELEKDILKLDSAIAELSNPSAIEAQVASLSAQKQKLQSMKDLIINNN